MLDCEHLYVGTDDGLRRLSPDGEQAAGIDGRFVVRGTDGRLRVGDGSGGWTAFGPEFATARCIEPA